MDVLFLDVMPDHAGAGAGALRFGGRIYRCALGRGGVIAATEKREGDGCTPIGKWPLRSLYFRADRENAPRCALPAQAIKPDDGWCDDPAHERYNRPVTHPFPASAERLWREDGLYDLTVILGHNDDPPRPGLGSAIFLHIAKNDYEPTAGCVALERDNLRELLTAIDGPAVLRVREGERSDGQ